MKWPRHKSLKRIFYRCVEEIDATRKISKVTSFKEGLETFQGLKLIFKL